METKMNVSPAFGGGFIEGFLLSAVSYVLLSSILQFKFYRRQGSNPERWKVQPEKANNLRETEARRWWVPFLSLFRGGRDKNGRHPLHGWFATFNTLMACTFAGTVTRCIGAGKTKVYWDTAAGFSLPRTAVGLLLSLVWQTVVSYYWHRLGHLPPVYKRLHKYHHVYKAPEPFDDMMVHPLEAFGYYLQCYAPPFLFAMPLSSFLLYMTVCGVCEVLDHSGVNLAVPGLYHTADHDRHHSRFEVNYGFPFPFMDILHGTYEGRFLGRRYSASSRTRLKKGPPLNSRLSVLGVSQSDGVRGG